MNRSLEIYLNDHLAGSVGAVEVVRRCVDDNAGTPLARFLTGILTEIEEDRQTLEGLMERAQVNRNPFKQAGAWLGEKVSRLKFGSEDKALPNLLSLESLSLGVEGKRCLWRSLQRVAGSEQAIAGVDFDRLIQRAEAQRAGLERERLALAASALVTSAGVSR